MKNPTPPVVRNFVFQWKGKQFPHEWEIAVPSFNFSRDAPIVDWIAGFEVEHTLNRTFRCDRTSGKWHMSPFYYGSWKCQDAKDAFTKKTLGGLDQLDGRVVWFMDRWRHNELQFDEEAKNEASTSPASAAFFSPRFPESKNYLRMEIRNRIPWIETKDMIATFSWVHEKWGERTRESNVWFYANQAPRYKRHEERELELEPLRYSRFNTFDKIKEPFTLFFDTYGSEARVMAIGYRAQVVLWWLARGGRLAVSDMSKKEE